MNGFDGGARMRMVVVDGLGRRGDVGRETKKELEGGGRRGRRRKRRRGRRRGRRRRRRR